MSRRTKKGQDSQGKIISIFKELDSKGIQATLAAKAKEAALAFGLELLELDTLELCV